MKLLLNVRFIPDENVFLSCIVVFHYGPLIDWSVYECIVSSSWVPYLSFPFCIYMTFVLSYNSTIIVFFLSLPNSALIDILVFFKLLR